MSDERFTDFTDERLETVLGTVLAGPDVEPSDDAVARIRAAALARRDATVATTTATSATTAQPTRRPATSPPASVTDMTERAGRRVRPAPRMLLGAAATVAVAFGLGALLGWALRGDDAGLADGFGGDGVVEFDGTMSGVAGDDAELIVVKTGIGREIALSTDALEILPTGEYYEIWFVAPDDRPGSPNRISAGTFHPDDEGRSDVRFAAAVDPTLFPTIQITAEPKDGDPRASGQVVLEATIDG